ncbi:mariner Mos1 transposase [Elysia marginata]|uniref:Mariner Mos1 transposase n=1 Tax=Elysia marginata TaxID=1093978 RepID=A0AAV4J8N4_9GAST|nr:mariner Mos1 transposase [Elysia marginata]
MLTDEQKESRVNFSRNFLRRFQTEQNDFLGRIITGDETEMRVYSWDPETKRQSAEWRDFDEHRPEKVRRKQVTLKVMHMIFFYMNGVILLWPVPIGTTINAQNYKKVLQDKLRPAIRKKPPRLLESGILFHHDNACDSPYGPGSDRRFRWLQVGTAGASSLFT